ncbi:glycoside hydrolase family 88/105 protein [Sphingobacterium sp. SYP-B4668]|uniref:glycoside hydrolase family 88/105 protein n=1 Tax=Sphingobacterium sp. SYP-B4668 TaxID=2996035 RepID=UPI00053237F1|nr:glycoside hydrolase family 88 protein [Sphingobacterium sp. SYP-B4668]
MSKNVIRLLIAHVLLSFLIVQNAHSQSYDLKHFPKGSQPKEIGIKLTERYLETPHSHWGYINSKHKTTLISYPDVCVWLGGLWFTKAIKDEGLYGRLVDRFEPLFTTEKHLVPSMRPKDHNVVDFYVFGALPLELYKVNRDAKYLDLGMKYADGQWILPENPNQTEKKWHDEGYSWQTRIWIDDMFMITAVQAQAYLTTGDEKYIDRAAREMVLYLDRIQRENGLFYHAPGTPFFWSRGNGWMAVGMAEMLRMLPKNNQYRPRIEAAYAKMMETLLRYQAYDGMWGQIIDDPNSWKETSGTAMFTYAMVTGVKNGWLDKKIYGAAARKAWLSLLTYLNEDNNIRNVCEGTGAKNDYQYYLDRKKLTGDLHGQAALLWCAYALASDSKGK